MGNLSLSAQLHPSSTRWRLREPMVCFRVLRYSYSGSQSGEYVWTDGCGFGSRPDHLVHTVANMMDRYPSSGESWRSTGTAGFRAVMDRLSDRAHQLDAWQSLTGLPDPLVLEIEAYVAGTAIEPEQCSCYCGGN